MKPARKPSCLIALACIGGILPPAAHAQTIVWTNANRIQKKSVNGGPVETVVQFTAPQVAQYIDYDPIDKKLYYLFFPGGPTALFQRCNLDGSEPEDIPTPGWGNFALNIVLRKLYWNDADGFYRSDLDGTGVEFHSYGASGVTTMEPVGNTLYFGTGGGLPKAIWRADADGSNEQLLHNTGQPLDLAYDPVEEKIYVAEVERIDRLNTDGSGFQQTVPNTAPEHIEVDYRGRKIYWIDTNGASRIRRANLDGSNAENFVTAVDQSDPSFNPVGLTIVHLATIPTLSDWGLAATGVLVLCAGFTVLRKRMKAGR